MNIQINKDELLETLNSASKFTSSKLSSTPILQGVYLKGENNEMHMYSTNLNQYFHTIVSAKFDGSFSCVIDPKKVSEYVSLFTGETLELEIKEKQMVVKQGKSQGSFPFVAGEDFPIAPRIDENAHVIPSEFFTSNLALVLFSASEDETRPTLTGVNFLTKEDLVLVSTDGFRLSVMKMKKDLDLPSVIVPASFLEEIVRYIGKEKTVSFMYSPSEKMVAFSIGKSMFCTRIIEGDFPPFERVIPAEKNTTVTIDRAELLRNVKLVSIFARDYSNVIILDFKKEGLFIRPKMEGGEENVAFMEVSSDGEEQKIAFNYRFLLDFLNVVGGEKVVVELVRPNAPAVFRTPNNSQFLHIIMPVRLQEE